MMMRTCRGRAGASASGGASKNCVLTTTTLLAATAWGVRRPMLCTPSPQPRQRADVAPMASNVEPNGGGSKYLYYLSGFSARAGEASAIQPSTNSGSWESRSFTYCSLFVGLTHAGRSKTCFESVGRR